MFRDEKEDKRKSKKDKKKQKQLSKSQKLLQIYTQLPLHLIPSLLIA